MKKPTLYLFILISYISVVAFFERRTKIEILRYAQYDKKYEDLIDKMYL